MKGKRCLIMILSLLVSVYHVKGQSGEQYLNATIGGGVNTIIYDPKLGDNYSDFGGNFNLEYNYFFNKHWGIGSGVGLSYYQSEYKSNNNFGYMRTDKANYNQQYYYQIILSGWKERQKMMNLEIPIGVYYKTPGRKSVV